MESCTFSSWLPLLLAGSLICATPARADNSRWLFVPVLVDPKASESEQAAIALAETLERAVSERRSVEPNRDAATRFETVHSSEPAHVSDEQLDRLLQIVGDGIRSLAFGKRAKAQGELQSIEDLNGPVRDYLQRAPERAQLLFDACALKSQLLLREKQNDQAQQQMVQCVRTWPGYKPGRAAAGARKLFESASAALEEEPHGTLSIQGRRSGCTVRINGIELGKSPAKLRVSPGFARVQLECDPNSPGRIHAVAVGTSATTLTIDEEFDSVVRTDGSLWLAYPNAGVRAARVDADAETIGRVSDANHVVLLLVDAAGHGVTVRTRGQDVATLALTSDGSATDVNVVVGKLLATSPQPPIKSVQAPRLIAPPPPLPAHVSEHDVTDELADDSPADDARLVLGVTVASVGAIGLGVSWVLYAERYSLRDKLYFGEVSYSSLDRFRSLAPWTLFSAGIGGAVIVAAEPLLLPSSESVPTAAWIAGGVGAALAIAGLVFGAAGSHCQPQASSPCDGFAADALFGPMLALHALPLVSVPLIYVVRSWSGSSSLALTVSDGGISARGAF